MIGENARRISLVFWRLSLSIKVSSDGRKKNQKRLNDNN
jgi:hypothetical protein